MSNQKLIGCTGHWKRIILHLQKSETMISLSIITMYNKLCYACKYQSGHVIPVIHVVQMCDGISALTGILTCKRNK